MSFQNVRENKRTKNEIKTIKGEGCWKQETYSKFNYVETEETRMRHLYLYKYKSNLLYILWNTTCL